MNFDPVELKTDDEYVLSDNLAMRLHLIPIAQEEDYTGITVSLDALNDTRESCPIMSSDLVVSKNGKTLDRAKYFGGTIHIMDLRPGKSISIGAMHIVEGIGKENNGKFSNMCAPYYDPVSVQGHSALVVDPTTFHFKIRSHRNCSVQYLVNGMHRSLVDRLKSYATELRDVDGEYVSSRLRVGRGKDVTVITFPKEFRSIPAAIAHYCYLIDPDIDRVSACVKHPAADTGIIKIRHANPIKIVRMAIDHLIRDLDIVRDALV